STAAAAALPGRTPPRAHRPTRAAPATPIARPPALAHLRVVSRRRRRRRRSTRCVAVSHSARLGRPQAARAAERARRAAARPDSPRSAHTAWRTAPARDASVSRNCCLSNTCSDRTYVQRGQPSTMTLDAHGSLWLDNPLAVLGVLALLYAVVCSIHVEPRYLGRHADFWQLAQRLLDSLRRIRVVLQRAREIGVVGAHVKVPVPRQVEQDHALLASLSRRERFVDCRADRVRRFGRRQDALTAGELDGRLEDRV